MTGDGIGIVGILFTFGVFALVMLLAFATMKARQD